MIEIRRIEGDRMPYRSLLLEADEDERMLDKYFYKGELFAVYDGALKAACILMPLSPDECELMNIAVVADARRKGYGRKLLEHLFAHAKGGYQTMVVRTGDSPMTIPFYEGAGFTVCERVKDYFPQHYGHPIIEDGLELRDQIVLRRAL